MRFQRCTSVTILVLLLMTLTGCLGGSSGDNQYKHTTMSNAYYTLTNTVRDDMAIWLRAQDLHMEEGDRVSVWRDSAAHEAFIQNDPSRRPVIRKKRLFGWDTVSFDCTTFLTAGNKFNQVLSMPDSNYIVVVLGQTYRTQQQAIVSKNAGSAGMMLGLTNALNPFASYANDAGNNRLLVAANSALEEETPFILAYEYNMNQVVNSDRVNFYLEGSPSDKTVFDNGSGQLNQYNLPELLIGASDAGNSNGFCGEVSDIIFIRSSDAAKARATQALEYFRQVEIVSE